MQSSRIFAIARLLAGLCVPITAIERLMSVCGPTPMCPSSSLPHIEPFYLSVDDEDPNLLF
jgi:hypothetical protein